MRFGGLILFSRTVRLGGMHSTAAAKIWAVREEIVAAVESMAHHDEITFATSNGRGANTARCKHRG